MLVSAAIAPSFCGSDRPSVLARVRHAGVDVTVWRREIAPRLAAELAKWTHEADVEPFDEVVPAKAPPIERAVAVLPDAVRDAVAFDASMLLAYFDAIVPARVVRLFLGVVREDQCRKFHVDAVALRMVTTYVGPGTEWLDEADVDRAALARRIRSPAAANAEIVRRPDGVRRARPGDVLMLKGSRDATAAGRGAVHRSPPIEHRGERRFVLMATAGGPDS